MSVRLQRSVSLLTALGKFSCSFNWEWFRASSSCFCFCFSVNLGKPNCKLAKAGACHPRGALPKGVQGWPGHTAVDRCFPHAVGPGWGAPWHQGTSQGQAGFVGLCCGGGAPFVAKWVLLGHVAAAGGFVRVCGWPCCSTAVGHFPRVVGAC